MLHAVVKHYYQELVGFVSGSSAGVYGMVVGKIHYVDILQAIAMAFLTGAAGAAGGMFIKWLFNGNKRRDEADQ